MIRQKTQNKSLRPDVDVGKIFRLFANKARTKLIQMKRDLRTHSDSLGL